MIPQRLALLDSQVQCSIKFKILRKISVADLKYSSIFFHYTNAVRKIQAVSKSHSFLCELLIGAHVCPNEEIPSTYLKIGVVAAAGPIKYTGEIGVHVLTYLS